MVQAIASQSHELKVLRGVAALRQACTRYSACLKEEKSGMYFERLQPDVSGQSIHSAEQQMASAYMCVVFVWKQTVCILC